MLKHSRKAEI